MAPPKTLVMGALNIKIHPHSPELYVSLMNDVFEMGEPVKIRGSDWGVLNYIREITADDPLEGMFGEFYRFLQINPDDPWLDIKKRIPLKDEKGEPIPQVEESKKPNMKEVEFVFYPRYHRLFYDAKSFSPNMAKIFWAELFHNEKIRKKYGTVDVEVESSEEVIERILKIPSLTKLDISITRPNGDVLSDQEEEILKRMEKQKIRRLHETMTSPKEDGIEPDDKTIALMKVATSNGRVDAVGYAGEERVEESTRPHPYIERDKYDPEKTTLLRAMINLSSVIVRKFRAGE